jgi:ankyrin repeat protein
MDYKNIKDVVKKGDVASVSHLDITDVDLLNDLIAIAADEGKLEMVEYLIEKGATEYRYALRWAAFKGHLNIVKLLLSKVIDDASLLYAILGRQKKVVELLIHYGVDVHANDEYALVLAIDKGYAEIVKCLIKAGADVRKVDYDSLLKNNYKEVLKVILDSMTEEELLPFLVSKNEKVRGHAKKVLKKYKEDKK